MLSLQNSIASFLNVLCVWENVIIRLHLHVLSLREIAGIENIHSKEQMWLDLGWLYLTSNRSIHLAKMCVKPENGEVTNTGSEGNVFIFKNFQKKNDDILLPDSNKHNISKADLDIDHLCRYQGILLFAHSIVGWRSQPEIFQLGPGRWAKLRASIYASF